MKKTLALASVLALAACASAPTGPSVMVLPGSGKSFDQFRFDDNECRQFAQNQLGTSAEQAQMDSGAKSAAMGAAVGALAGAALGGSGRSAVGGAALGTAGGAIAGTGAGSTSAHTVQQRYDIAYQQCMYAKGNQIPMASRYEPRHAPAAAPRPSAPPPPPPPPPAGAAPPPPVGTPPPPPAG
ncbi:MAG: hypothetical protein JO035_07820 [Betaproteobacteria bacterium]|nr:hypothetical protein [Betaproteobacteria bacterium]